MKKGTEVWMITDYDHKATVYVTRLVITSIGKKQGTAIHTKDGKNIMCRLYAPYQSIYPVADIADINEFALALAVEQKERWRQHYVRAAEWYQEGASPGYHESMKKDCQTLLDRQPSVRFNA